MAPKLQHPQPQSQIAGSQEQPPASVYSAKKPCVGLPVQFGTPEGAVPAILQRQHLTDEALWDVKVSLEGTDIWILRPAVEYSATLLPGRWSFLPS